MSMKRRDFLKNSVLISSGLGLSYCGTKNIGKTRVVVIGFDGANWPTIDPLIEKGKLPFLKKLKEESAWGYFKTFKPTKSNVVWTSIATGKTMMKHGIMDFSYLKKNGVKMLYNKSQRKEPAIWQILNSFNKKSVVINWWVSDPPDKINGVMLSDKFRRVVNNGQNVENLTSTVWPESYFKKLLRFADDNSDYKRVIEKTGMPDFPEEFHKLYPKGKIKRIPVLNIYQRLIKHDSMTESVTKYLEKNLDYDFFATYFRFPDIVQHLITHFMDADFKKKLIASFKSGNVSEDILNEATLRVSDLMYPIYRYMEKILKNIIESEKNKDTYFMIMSDHGFSFYDHGYNHYNLPKDYKAPDGIFMMSGPKVRKGQLKDVSVFDVAPTILNIFDEPVGKNMDGKVLKEALKINNKIRYKVYKMKHYKVDKNRKVDKEALEELKAIGYIN